MRSAGRSRCGPERDQILEEMIDYASRQQADGIPVRHIGRHLLGLYHGQPGGKQWRRQMSECLQNHAAGPKLWRWHGIDLSPADSKAAYG